MVEQAQSWLADKAVVIIVTLASVAVSLFTGNVYVKFSHLTSESELRQQLVRQELLATKEMLSTLDKKAQGDSLTLHKLDLAMARMVVLLEGRSAAMEDIARRLERMENQRQHRVGGQGSGLQAEPQFAPALRPARQHRAFDHERWPY